MYDLMEFEIPNLIGKVLSDSNHHVATTTHSKHGRKEWVVDDDLDDLVSLSTSSSTISSSISTNETLTNPSYHKSSFQLKILSIIGYGSYAVVYKAEDLTTGNLYAVKCIVKQGLNSFQLSLQYREVELLSQLSSHPNIITLHHVIDTPDHLFLVLDLCECDLFEAIVHEHGFSPEETQRIFLTLIDTVDYLHAHGIYHRDLKPENILFTPNGEIKIADFGLACRDTWSRDFDCGTLRYEPPECVDLSSKGYSPEKSDLWALGVILINLRFERNPWTYASEEDPIYYAFINKTNGGDLLQQQLGLTDRMKDLFTLLFQSDPNQRLTLSELRMAMQTMDEMYDSTKFNPIPTEELEKAMKQHQNHHHHQKEDREEVKMEEVETAATEEEEGDSNYYNYQSNPKVTATPIPINGKGNGKKGNRDEKNLGQSFTFVNEMDEGITTLPTKNYPKQDDYSSDSHYYDCKNDRNPISTNTSNTYSTLNNSPEFLKYNKEFDMNETFNDMGNYYYDYETKKYVYDTNYYNYQYTDNYCYVYDNNEVKEKDNKKRIVKSVHPSQYDNIFDNGKTTEKDENISLVSVWDEKNTEGNKTSKIQYNNLENTTTTTTTNMTTSSSSFPYKINYEKEEWDTIDIKMSNLNINQVVSVGRSLNQENFVKNTYSSSSSLYKVKNNKEKDQIIPESWEENLSDSDNALSKDEKERKVEIENTMSSKSSNLSKSTMNGNEKCHENKGENERINNNSHFELIFNSDSDLWEINSDEYVHVKSLASHSLTSDVYSNENHSEKKGKTQTKSIPIPIPQNKKRHNNKNSSIKNFKNRQPVRHHQQQYNNNNNKKIKNSKFMLMSSSTSSAFSSSSWVKVNLVENEEKSMKKINHQKEKEISLKTTVKTLSSLSDDHSKETTINGKSKSRHEKEKHHHHHHHHHKDNSKKPSQHHHSDEKDEQLSNTKHRRKSLNINNKQASKKKKERKTERSTSKKNPSKKDLNKSRYHQILLNEKNKNNSLRINKSYLLTEKNNSINLSRNIILKKKSNNNINQTTTSHENDKFMEVVQLRIFEKESFNDDKVDNNNNNNSIQMMQDEQNEKKNDIIYENSKSLLLSSLSSTWASTLTTRSSSNSLVVFYQNYKQRSELTLNYNKCMTYLKNWSQFYRNYYSNILFKNNKMFNFNFSILIYLLFGQTLLMKHSFINHKEMKNEKKILIKFPTNYFNQFFFYFLK